MAQAQVKGRKSDTYKQTIKAGTHSLVSDADKEFGGNAEGPNPHELLLSSLGACTSITLQMYAQRKNWDLQEVVVDLKEEEVEDPNEAGKKTTKVTRNISVSGNLEPDQVDGLKAIADKCPIHKILVGHKIIATEIKKLTSV
ncbi:MAG TPA: OsmC family protein [Planktothrix sp.]|jgi:putative redox protein